MAFLFEQNHKYYVDIYKDLNQETSSSNNQIIRIDINEFNIERYNNTGIAIYVIVQMVLIAVLYTHIIETFYKVRSMKRELLELHNESNKEVQNEKMKHFGETLTDIVMPDLETTETESSLEINFFIGKVKHSVKRIRKEK